MYKAKRTVSREIGLQIGAICSRYFLKSEHLHYGYWTNDLEVDITNLSIAQENYAKFLISHIPDGVEKILDVGCGTGQIAKMLVDIGYQVDCVSPSSYLSEQARQLLGNTGLIFECLYEQLETENRYDLILFSESFQYINPEDAIKQTFGLLNEGGYVLICDIFKKDIPGKSPLSGGHPLRRFYGIVSEYPLEMVEDLDITEQTAPTLDIVNDMLNKVAKPSIDLAQQLLDDRYPAMSKFLKFLYRKKIDKINKKYFNKAKTGENFKKFKSYRLLLYRKAEVTSEQQPDFIEPCPDAVGLESREEIKISAAALAGTKRFEQILNWLRKRRTVSLIIVFLIIIAENIIRKEEPHELLSLKEQVSILAIIGCTLVLIGTLIRFWARGHIERGRLFTTGPYAIVRHPLLLGSLLIVCGILFQLNDWMNWVIVLPVFTIFYGAAIIYEERSLQKKFDKQWQLYKAKTPAIIPLLPNWSFLRPTHNWSWKVYLKTGEVWVTAVLLSLPLMIELIIGDFVFDDILGI